MTDNEMQQGNRCIYKDKVYEIVECNDLEMKSPSDGNWYPAVAYSPIGEAGYPEAKFYVRTLEDFQEKFKPVSPYA